MGLRVLARSGPECALLEGLFHPTFPLLGEVTAQGGAGIE
jgi:hypothetical protein